MTTTPGSTYTALTGTSNMQEWSCGIQGRSLGVILIAGCT
jgi:hypothetical protein